MKKIDVDVVGMIPNHEELVKFAAIVKNWEKAVQVVVGEGDEEALKEFDETCEILGLDKGLILQSLVVVYVLAQSQLPSGDEQIG